MCDQTLDNSSESETRGDVVAGRVEVFTTDRTTIVQKGGLFEVCLKVCRGSVSILFTWEFDMQLSLYGETSCKTD